MSFGFGWISFLSKRNAGDQVQLDKCKLEVTGEHDWPRVYIPGQHGWHIYCVTVSNKNEVNTVLLIVSTRVFKAFNIYDKRLITNREMTPSAMESGNSIIAFNLFPTFGTFSVRVPFNPMMKHLLCCSGWFNIGGDARRRSPLNASFVNRVLAYWWE